jgi:hypothetical protein
MNRYAEPVDETQCVCASGWQFGTNTFVTVCGGELVPKIDIDAPSATNAVLLSALTVMESCKPNGY